ncbi:MAG: twin-arginine translocase TatA/TatE family subunit [Planctomycetaceae bacterium]
MSAFGPAQLMILALVALLLFGRRLPGVMRSLGEGVRAFREEVRNVEGSVREDA